MSGLMQEMNQWALDRGLPLSVQLDVTYRCNERCVHCYLDHDDHGEMTTAEIKDVLDQVAEAGVFFLTLSGGEVLMRMDFFEIVEHARALLFDVKIKTNAFMIREPEADRILDLGVRVVQVSIYSHRSEVHDAITKLPGSLQRSIAGIRLLQSRGVKVIIANVLMQQNLSDYAGVKVLAEELGAGYTIDPTITPMMDGNRSIVALGIGGDDLQQVFRNPELVGNVDEFCAPPPKVDEGVLHDVPCSAGHTACYISPYGDVFPCVQFPLPTGNIRWQKFFGYLESFPADERGPLDPGEGPERLLVVLARQQLHALSRLGLCGRKYVGTIHRGLREVVLPDGRADGEHAAARVVETAHSIGQ